MKVINQDIKATRAHFSVAAEPKELEDARSHVGQALSGRVKAPGFRPGKVPADMVFKYADPKDLNNEFLNYVVNNLYIKGFNSLDLKVIGEPKIEVSKFVPFDTVEITVDVPIIGDIKLPDYKNLKVAKNKIAVTDELIDQNIKELQKRSAVTKEVERPAKNGDMATIDFEATDFKTKEKLPQATGLDYQLMLGDKTFIPGFEDKLVGLSAGQSKTFAITFPKDYHDKSFALRKVNFAVTVKAVNEVSLPKVDEKFASSLGPFKTVKELKDQIKSDLVAETERRATVDYEDRLLTSLAEKTIVAIDNELIEIETEGLIANARQSALNRGQTWAEFLLSRGQSEQEYQAEVKEIALIRIRGGVAITEIARKEDINVSDEEIDRNIEALKKQYQDPAMRSELDDPSNRREIGFRILSEKVLDFIQQPKLRTA